MSSKAPHQLEFTLLAPPHEVPQAVRGEFDKQINRFVIEIRYLDDEDFKRTAIDEIVSLRIGKKSRRLLGIELDTTRVNVTEVQFEVKELEQEIERALDKLVRGESGREQSNYSMAKSAIESKRALLLDPNLLVPAQ
jgi:hypothetical protein